MKYLRLKRILISFLYVCLTALMLLLLSCAGKGSVDNSGSEQTIAASEEITQTPAPTPDPDATPATVDLSEYQEIPLPQLEPLTDGEEIALLHTSLGIIKLRFFPGYAQKAVQNFKTHAKAGYYDGVIFYNVIENSIISSGDPEGTGTGGSSIWGQPFGPETTPCLHHIRGALSMIHGAEPVSQGSQFFIVANNELGEETRTELASYKERQNEVVAETTDGTQVPMAQVFPERIIDRYLEEGGIPAFDLQFAVFGQVIEGFEVVDKIASVETSQEAETMNRPLQDITIDKITFEYHKA